MKKGMYVKLSVDGIKKNKRLYAPYICAFCGMVIMNYIMFFLAGSERINALRGGEAIHGTLSFGCVVLAFFSCLFLFYTNSFIVKRRQKEYGLYGVLGMNKKQLAGVNFFENFFVSLLSLAVGLVLGIALSKFAELGLIRIVGGQTDFDFGIDITAVLKTALTFAIGFVLVFLNGARQILFSKTVTLLKSERAGEKPPKGNVIFAVLGIALIGWAYYTAITIEDPLTAMSWFFFAVMAVIAGTYLLMISGSVALCRLLQKNKSYYYKKNHFISVSSMAYRMKRNGAGLASICILSTMVLVTVSTTTCMYFGCEESLKLNFPRQINMTLNCDNSAEKTAAKAAKIENFVYKRAQESSFEVSDVRRYGCAYTYGFLTGNTADCSSMERLVKGSSELYEFMILSSDDYTGLSGESLSLAEGTAALRTVGFDYKEDGLNFVNGPRISISDSKRIKRAAFFSDRIRDGNLFVVVLNNPDFFDEYLSPERTDSPFNYSLEYGFDTSLDADGQIALVNELADVGTVTDVSQTGIFSVASRAENEGDYYGVYGGVFYLGILLSIVFALAAVLIIYYKQVSEGYEDQASFDIMAKVGMTEKDINSAVNSQILTVFFIPLVFSAIHLCFAFPMIKKILELFALMNDGLFILTTALSFAVFTLFYIIVYRLTARAYLGIVRNKKRR